MKDNAIVLLLFCIVGYLFSRAFIEIAIYALLTPKKYKKYKKKTTLNQRYWIIGVKTFFPVKYVKSENRMINYPMIMSVYSSVHATMFVSLMAVFAIAILSYVNLINEKGLVVVIVIYLIEIIASFGIYACVNNYEHYNYHRRRNGKKE
jgi:hypothetical protein